MPAPYVEEFTSLGLTSVVLDKDDFNAFVDELDGLFNVGTEDLQRIKDAEYLPLMSRGKKTQVFFDRWGVQTDKLAVVVRGAGPKIAERLLRMISARVLSILLILMRGLRCQLHERISVFLKRWLW